MKTLCVVEGRLGVGIDILGGIARELALADPIRLRSIVVLVAKESSDVLLLAIVLKMVAVCSNIALVVVGMAVVRQSSGSSLQMPLLLMLLLKRIGHSFKGSLALPVLNHRHIRGHRLELRRGRGEHRR